MSDASPQWGGEQKKKVFPRMPIFGCIVGIYYAVAVCSFVAEYSEDFAD